MASHSSSRRSSSHQTAHARGVDDEDDSTSMATSLQDDPKYAIATSFLATMLNEVVIDTALLIHKSVTRKRRSEGTIKGGCPVCKTRYVL
jgi:hypothetical protein